MSEQQNMQANDDLTTIEKAWATLREEMVEISQWAMSAEVRHFAVRTLSKMDKLLEGDE